MVCLGFEPGTANGRRRPNHGAMAATNLFFESIRFIWRRRSLEREHYSVTRFGKISQLWQFFKRLLQITKSLFCICLNINLLWQI